MKKIQIKKAPYWIGALASAITHYSTTEKILERTRKDTENYYNKVMEAGHISVARLIPLIINEPDEKYNNLMVRATNSLSIFENDEIIAQILNPEHLQNDEKLLELFEIEKDFNVQKIYP